ncbi:MAG: amidase [Planctomycetes bacterium]|nr:amidase [Planctomycetota bacterium]
MPMPPVSAATIAQVSDEIRRKQRSCLDAVAACLARIDQFEPEIRAWVSVDREGAQAQARQLDQELALGQYRGPLHGIPIGIKDLVDVAGWPTAAGAPWLKDAVAHMDAPLVVRLREAGAVILGKTVTTQFACFDPPVTRNPWDHSRTPGGSSSGSAAAVATGMCLGAIGSQTGGSITRPAAFCGVAGCKPTFQRVPLTGVYPLSKSLDHGGPIAQTVGDLRLLLEALIGSRLVSGKRGSDLSHPVRLGRLDGMFRDRAEPGAWQIYEAALTRLAQAGAEICEIALPATFDEVLASHRTIMTREIADVHRPFYRQHQHEYLPAVRGVIEAGLQVSDDAYASARQHQRGLLPAVVAAMQRVDALICPAAIGPAPSPETTGDPCFNAPWSYTGQPTVSFPFDLSAEGLPLAVQLVGRPDDEGALFDTAAWCERILRTGAQ